ncbi:M48 family metallopeptidase [bacterium]|nr:M48 family metallopeptidase [bacterium]
MKQRLIAAAAVYALLGIFFTLVITATPPRPALAGGLKFKLSKKQEASLGADMNKELASEPGFISKGKEYEMVQRIGKRLVERNKLTNYDYKFFYVKQDEVNAFATPGGYIYVTRGLMKQMGYDEAMVAGVMAHELGHAKDRHTARGAEKRIQAALGIGILGMVLGDKGDKTLMDALGGAAGMATLKYSRDFEEWADRSGVELSYEAGYDAYGLTRGLEMLNALYGSTDSVSEWMASHPSTKDRVARTMRIAEDVTDGRQMGYVKIPAAPKGSPLYEKYGKGVPGSSSVTKRTSPVKN